MRASVIFALASAVPSVFATIYVTSPVATTTFNGGQTAIISWEDDGHAPTLATIGTCSVGIYAGNSQQQTLLQDIVDSVNVATTASIQFTVDPTIGPDSSVYFIRFTSNTYKDPTTPGYAYEQFSARYTMGNMMGQFNSTVQAQINSSGATPLAGSSSATSSTAASSTSTRAAASVASNTVAKATSATPSLAASAAATAKSNGASAPAAAVGIAKAVAAGLMFGALMFVL